MEENFLLVVGQGFIVEDGPILTAYPLPDAEVERLQQASSLYSTNNEMNRAFLATWVLRHGDFKHIYDLYAWINGREYAWEDTSNAAWGR